jgi:DNA-binding protein Fis
MEMLLLKRIYTEADCDSNHVIELVNSYFVEIRDFSSVLRDSQHFSIKDSNAEKMIEKYRFLMFFYPIERAHNSMIAFLTSGLDSTNITVKSKSIRSINELIGNQQVSQDVQVYLVSKLRNLLTDHSPSVRDAVVEVLGKYLEKLSGPKLSELYLVLCSRAMVLSISLQDTSTNVRKRILRLSSEIFLREISKVDSVTICCEVFARIVSRLSDTEETVVVYMY